MSTREYLIGYYIDPHSLAFSSPLKLTISLRGVYP